MRYLIALTLAFIPTTVHAQTWTEQVARYNAKHGCPIWQDCHNPLVHSGNTGVATGPINFTRSMAQSFNVEAPEPVQYFQPQYTIAVNSDPCALVPSGTLTANGRQLLTMVDGNKCNEQTLSAYPTEPAQQQIVYVVATPTQSAVVTDPKTTEQDPQPAGQNGWTGWILVILIIAIVAFLVDKIMKSGSNRRRRELEAGYTRAS